MSDDVGFFIGFIGYGSSDAIVITPPAPPFTTVLSPTAAAVFFVMELDVYQPGSPPGGYALARGSHPRGSAFLIPVVPESSDTLRASDAGYRTRSNDVGGVTVYPALLDQAFEIDRHIALEPSQASTSTFGSLRLSNLGQRFDAYIRSRNCDSRAVKLLMGSKPWDTTRGIYVDPPYATLRPFFGGTASVWALSETELEIPLKDPTYLADHPLQSSIYAGTGGLLGGSDLTGRKLPITRGGTASNPVLNVPLVAVDTVHLIYQWTDGPGTVATLYEGGAAVFVYDGDVSDLYAGQPPAGGHYRTNNARGLLQTGSKPVRALTADVTGAFATAGLISTAAALALYVLSETLAIPAAQIDTASFSAADNAFPFVAGIYVSDDTRAIDVVQLLLGSIGARLITTRSGLLSVFVLRKPAAGAMPVLRLSPSNVVDVTPVALPTSLNPPPFRWRVGYARINQVQTSDFNGSITDTRKTQIGTAFSIASWSSDAVLRAWRKPNDPDVVSTALLLASDAQSLANAFGALFASGGGSYTVTLPIDLAVSLDLGKTVLLDWPLADLPGGKIGVLIGEQVRSYDATVQFTVLA